MTDPEPRRFPRSRPLHDSDPRQFGAWRVHARWSAGGMGLTYLASDSAGQWGLVKTLRPELVHDGETTARFAREVRTLSELRVIRIPRILDSGFQDARPFHVTEFLGGLTLRDHVQEYGHLSAPKATNLAAALTETIAMLHTSGVVHRDIKPANIILEGDGPYLVDFGIATSADATSLTYTGELLGSPGWLAPEQLKGESITAAADVFAWAAAVTFAATGRPPFTAADDSFASSYAVLHAEPTLDGVPRPLEPTLRSALSKDPAARPSAQELVTAVATNARRPSTADPDEQHTPTVLRDRDLTPGTRSRTTLIRRRPLAVGIPVVVLIAGLAGGVAALADHNTDTAAAQGPDAVPLPEITLDCNPEADPTTPGLVRFGHTYSASTDTSSIFIDYGDGKNYTSPDRENHYAAFWHAYPAEGSYGPVTATITDSTGQQASATCDVVDIRTAPTEQSAGSSEEPAEESPSTP